MGSSWFHWAFPWYWMLKTWSFKVRFEHNLVWDLTHVQHYHTVNLVLYRFMPKSILSGHFLSDSSFANTSTLLSFIEHGYVWPDSSDNVIVDMWNMKLHCPVWSVVIGTVKIIYGMSDRTLYRPSFLATCWWWNCCLLSLAFLPFVFWQWMLMNASGH